jgi:hypothetical protein
VVKDAFGSIGSAGGHASMAKAIISLGRVSEVWEIDPRNLRSINARAQREFLKALHMQR